MLVPCSKCGKPYEVSIEQVQSAPAGVVIVFAHTICPEDIPKVYSVRMIVTSKKGDEDEEVLSDVKGSVSGPTLIDVLDELGERMLERWEQFQSMAGFAEMDYPTIEGDTSEPSS